MPLNPDRHQRLVRQFSKASVHYSHAASVQYQSRLLLRPLVTHHNPKYILDVGCGPGGFTYQISQWFPQSQVVGIDIAEGMIHQAKKQNSHPNINYHLDAAESYRHQHPVELIMSNATLHWCEELQQACRSLCDSLDDQGQMIFSYFGPKTYQELGQSIKQVCGQSVPIVSEAFLTKKEVKKTLAPLFKDIQIIEKQLHKPFPNLMSLLREIKLTGTQGPLPAKKGLWTRSAINEIENAYRKLTPSLSATFQVFLVKAERKK